MHTISKEFHFSASHILKGLPDGHPCGRLHGHNYIVKIILSGPVNEHGFVQDYNDLKPVQKFIDENLDHQNLNNVFKFQPSVENMTKWLYDFLKPNFPLLLAVGMSETPKTWCYYQPKRTDNVG